MSFRWKDKNSKPKSKQDRVDRYKSNEEYKAGKKKKEAAKEGLKRLKNTRGKNQDYSF